MMTPTITANEIEEWNYDAHNNSCRFYNCRPGHLLKMLCEVRVCVCARVRVCVCVCVCVCVSLIAYLLLSSLMLDGADLQIGDGRSASSRLEFEIKANALALLLFSSSPLLLFSSSFLPSPPLLSSRLLRPPPLHALSSILVVRRLLRPVLCFSLCSLLFASPPLPSSLLSSPLLLSPLLSSPS